jgi:hypothetical protein
MSGHVAPLSISAFAAGYHGMAVSVVPQGAGRGFVRQLALGTVFLPGDPPLDNTPCPCQNGRPCSGQE